MKKKAIYYPLQEGEISTYYKNAEAKLVATYGTKYSIDPAKIAKVTTHNTQIPAKISKANSEKQTAQASTVDKDQELHLGKTDLLLIFKEIEMSEIFDEADAEDLGFRRVSAPLDLNSVKPIISQVTLLDDKIIFDWVKSLLDGVLIEASFDGVNWEKLDKDNKSPFEDVRKNKVKGVAETRHFRFRYLKNDVPVGLYTDPIKVVCDIY